MLYLSCTIAKFTGLSGSSSSAQRAIRHRITHVGERGGNSWASKASEATIFLLCLLAFKCRIHWIPTLPSDVTFVESKINVPLPFGNHLCFNPLPTNDCKTRHETFTFMMSHPAMSLRDRLCASREGGAGGGGWVHPKGANSMAVSGLSFEQPLVGAG